MAENYEGGVLSYSMDWLPSCNAYFGVAEADFFDPQPGLAACRVEVGSSSHPDQEAAGVEDLQTDLSIGRTEVGSSHFGFGAAGSSDPVGFGSFCDDTAPAADYGLLSSPDVTIPPPSASAMTFVDVSMDTALSLDATTPPPPTGCSGATVTPKTSVDRMRRHFAYVSGGKRRGMRRRRPPLSFQAGIALGRLI
ncbi:uncharacterized protein LOC130764194 [Actinidia eriantha]|uniref:uncharacterized protein LOC130764194 n=1 Tax=Actinidia eriantha TaxID=165200 RepID=UPI0025844B4A|nr:uncharacterized protein LOC130764194 [Actinidia eriantha]